jgi:hypothetical protein
VPGGGEGERTTIAGDAGGRRDAENMAAEMSAHADLVGDEYDALSVERFAQLGGHIGEAGPVPEEAEHMQTIAGLPSILLVANPINHYLINSPMLNSLTKDPGGAITLYIQIAYGP